MSPENTHKVKGFYMEVLIAHGYLANPDAYSIKIFIHKKFKKTNFSTWFLLL